MTAKKALCLIVGLVMGLGVSPGWGEAAVPCERGGPPGSHLGQDRALPPLGVSGASPTPSGSDGFARGRRFFLAGAKPLDEKKAKEYAQRRYKNLLEVLDRIFLGFGVMYEISPVFVEDVRLKKTFNALTRYQKKVWELVKIQSEMPRPLSREDQKLTWASHDLSVTVNPLKRGLPRFRETSDRVLTKERAAKAESERACGTTEAAQAQAAAERSKAAAKEAIQAYTATRKQFYWPSLKNDREYYNENSPFLWAASKVAKKYVETYKEADRILGQELGGPEQAKSYFTTIAESVDYLFRKLNGHYEELKKLTKPYIGTKVWADDLIAWADRHHGKAKKLLVRYTALRDYAGEGIRKSSLPGPGTYEGFAETRAELDKFFSRVKEVRALGQKANAAA
ncbi:MAG: hypothetical protein ACE5JS_19490, partial [Nitrospinota bacterium]